MPIDLPSLTITSALELLRQGEFTCLELAEACFRRIQNIDPLLNAFITPTLDLAVQEALVASSLYISRPSNLKELSLLGIPMAVKDLIDVMGIRTTAGSRFFGENLPSEDASAVLRLKLAGAVILGKTNTHEIALGVTGVNPHFGAAKNPWDVSCITGGSSSGSAAAVASGMSLGALGTDTGGSVRIPASLCGVVGLKPTFGRISTSGVMPLSWNLDHVGSLTRTVRDAALLLTVLAGFDPHDPVSQNVPAGDYHKDLEQEVKGWRIALAVGEYISSADAEVLEAVDEAALIFKDMGAIVEKVDLEWIAPAARANGQMTQADAAAFHRDRLAVNPEKFGEDVLERLREGAALTSSDYSLARRTQVESRRHAETFFDKYDLLMLPTTPTTAFAIEGTDAVAAARRLTRFTAPFNLTGVPALSLPCGFTNSGLPIGLQLVCRHWAEAPLLQAAQAYEQSTGWHNRLPPL